MIKLKISALSLIIFIGIGVAVYKGFNAWENSQKHDAPVPSVQSSIGEPSSIEGLAARGEKVSPEALTSKAEKVSFEEGLARIQQANTDQKKLADQLDFNVLIEHLRKGELIELIEHLRGGVQAKQEVPVRKGVQAEQEVPLRKGVQTEQTGKDVTKEVEAEVERLKAK